jgi:hypothetical protein
MLWLFALARPEVNKSVVSACTKFDVGGLSMNCTVVFSETKGPADEGEQDAF